LKDDPLESVRIASNALEKVRRHHTLDLRVRQILSWIESGLEPSYGVEEIADGSPAVTGYPSAPRERELNSQLETFGQMFGPVSIPDIPAVGRKISAAASEEDEIKAVLREFELAVDRRDAASARKLLEDAVSEFPELNAQLAYLYFCTGDFNRSLTTYLMALPQNAFNPDVLKNIGILTGKNGRFHEAALYIRAAMSSNPAADDVISLLDTLKAIEDLEEHSEGEAP